MAEAAQVEVANTPVARQGRPGLLIGLAVALMLALGASVYAWLAWHASAKSAAKVESVKLVKDELYLPMDPAFVVNFRDDDSLRYLQVGVTLMSHDPDAIAAAKNADPVIRDALVSLFSSKDYSIISDPAGRQKLQQQALAAVREIVQKRLGRPGIDALYFTSFVMQ
ncbi:flagellar basal body-associated FliL family protein [Rhodanobacter koreensis]